MSKLLRALLLLSLASISSVVWAEPKLVQVWQAEGLPVPESVLYYQHNQKDYVFVSLIDGGPSEVDGKGGIALISTTGEIINKEWVTGLNAPKGMAAKGNLLYVSDIDHLVVIDIDQAKVVASYPAAESKFLNDVAVNTQGEVFVSDTAVATVYRLKGDKLDVYIREIDSANGLAVVTAGLVVGSGKELKLIDKNKKVTVLAKDFAEAIDGIEEVQPGEYVVSCWPGMVYYMDAKGHLTRLIDSREEKINTADIGYFPAKKSVMIPNFFKNTVTAYQLAL